MFELGTVSHGTLREEALIPVFTEALRELNQSKVDELEGTYANVYKWLANTGAQFQVGVYFPEDMQGAASWLLNEELFQALNDVIPVPFVYFGSHVGDGADFGFWLDFDGIREALRFNELEFIVKQKNVGVYYYDDEHVLFLLNVTKGWNDYWYDFDGVEIRKLGNFTIDENSTFAEIEENTEIVVSV